MPRRQEVGVLERLAGHTGVDDSHPGADDAGEHARGRATGQKGREHQPGDLAGIGRDTLGREAVVRREDRVRAPRDDGGGAALHQTDLHREVLDPSE